MKKRITIGLSREYSPRVDVDSELPTDLAEVYLPETVLTEVVYQDPILNKINVVVDKETLNYITSVIELHPTKADKIIAYVNAVPHSDLKSIFSREVF